MLPCDCSGYKISLKVETEYLKRRFTYRLQGEEKHIAAEIANVYYLCDEGIHMGKRFTGAMTGINAVAGEHKLYADFFKFIYQDIEALKSQYQKNEGDKWKQKDRKISENLCRCRKRRLLL